MARHLWISQLLRVHCHWSVDLTWDSWPGPVLWCDGCAGGAGLREHHCTAVERRRCRRGPAGTVAYLRTSSTARGRRRSAAGQRSVCLLIYMSWIFVNIQRWIFMNIDEYSALATRLSLLLVCHKDFLVVELGSAVPDIHCQASCI